MLEALKKEVCEANLELVKHFYLGECQCYRPDIGPGGDQTFRCSL